MLVNLREQVQPESTLSRRWQSLRELPENKARLENPKAGRATRSGVRKNSRSLEVCSAQIAINLIHGKWKTRILSRLQHGPARLGELHKIFPRASKKMLAQHLREMERDGLVIRKDLSDRLLHVEYSLSDSGGLAVLRLISLLQEWSKEHLPFRKQDIRKELVAE